MSTPDDKPFLIRGFVVDHTTKRGVEGLRVEAWDKDLFIDDLVGSAVTGAQGDFSLEFGEDYFSELFFDRRPDLFFKVYRDGALIASTENSVLWNVECGETELTIEADLSTVTEHPFEHRSVEGQVFFDNGAPAAAITLRFYNRSFGGAETRLGEVKTDDRGSYVLTYDAHDPQVNLEARMLDAQTNEVSLSAVKYNAAPHEMMNLIAPLKAVALAPEYDRLIADLIKQVGDINKLANAREDDTRQDLTLLHQATGWDARLIALVVLAVRLRTKTGLTPIVLYALFRTGLPTDKDQLVVLSANTVGAALYKANGARIVSLSPAEITQAQADFETFANRVRNDVKAPGAQASFGELLAQSGLSDADQKLFAELFFAYQGAGASLWQAARDRGMSEAAIDTLRLQGKLAFLTYNNAALTGVLQPAIGSPDNLAQLVELDLHKDDEWKGRLRRLAADEAALDKLIPPVYGGQTVPERLDSYASDLARKVRLSFPTQVVTRMLAKDELDLGADHNKQDVHDFLQRATGLGFELGRVPVEKFVRDNRNSLFQTNTPEATIDATTAGVKKLQRLYQITPSNDSLKALLDHGFSSAHEVTAHTPDDFVNTMASELPPAEAELVYRKAQQVHAVAHNLLITAKQLDRTPPVYALSSSTERREQAIDNLITQYPRMESLFGSLDFCECEECRSVLSPAAYFVDLLQFLDREDWKTFLSAWKKNHAQQPYQPNWNYDRTGEAYPDERKKPYYALIERRPDLPHLSLTCENTQTVLPYIDLVNEILEYCLVNGKLDPSVAHDTGSTPGEELIAEPQNILPKAYTTLNDARFPLGLPFDLALETVRLFFDHLKTPFWQVLDVFRPADELYAPTQSPKAYYRADVFAEYLGLCPAERALLTNPDPLAKWHLLYGFDEKNNDAANQQDAVAALKSARTLAQRLGVSYQELIDIVCTNFVNPDLDSLAFLWKLKIGLSDIVRYFANRNDNKYADETAAMEDRLKALDQAYSLAQGTTLAALERLQQQGVFAGTLLLDDQSTSCNFDQTFLQFAGGRGLDGRDADAMVFVKLNFFVRLWRKLGWTIEETDGALRTFLPGNSFPLTRQNIGEALKTALVYMAHLQSLYQRLKPGPNGRLKLLPLWSILATAGKNPLYAQLFLTRGILKDDGAFDDPLNNYLSRQGVLIKDRLPASQIDHLPALQAALNLTADEIKYILADDQKVDDLSKSADVEKAFAAAPLSLANVSLLYRYGFLAKRLQLSVRDLIALKSLSGIDPFPALSAHPLQALKDDLPLAQTMQFVDMAKALKETGLQVRNLEYLLRHRFDPAGPYRPDAAALMSLVKNLATGLRRIQTEHAIPSDLAAFSDDLLQQKLSLVLPSDVVDQLVGILVGATEFEVSTGANSGLDPKKFAGEPRLKVSFDAVAQIQHLAYRGILLDERKQALKQLDSSSQFLGPLLDAVQKKARATFADVVETILGLLTATVDYEASEGNVNVPLTPDDFAGEARLRVFFDNDSHTQFLTYRGLLLEATRQELETKHQSTLLPNLLGAIQLQGQTFFEQFLAGALGRQLATIEFDAVETSVGKTDQLKPEDFASEPAIRVRYDEDSRTQYLTYRGLLTNSKKQALQTGSQILSNLLAAVQVQGRAFIGSFREGLLSAHDFDSFFGRPDDLPETANESRAKVAQAVLPFVQKKLARQLVAQTLVTALGADATLTEALLTEPSWLTDTAQPGAPLLEAFVAASQSGLTLSYFGSTDATGDPLEPPRIVSTAATKPAPDDAGKPGGTMSARLEGCFEVPAAGPYRFFIQFEKQGVTAEFRLDGWPDPVISGKAAKDNDEVSQFVELKAGVLYQFTVDVHDVNLGDVLLLVEGENLSPGSLDRLTLYPQTAIERFRHAHLLLSKTLQLIRSFALTEREVRYLLAHRSAFDDLDFNKLPTSEADYSPSRANNMFKQALRLADYVRLRRDLAGDEADLISVFETKLPDDAYKLVATLTRRDFKVVEATARQLQLIHASDFADEKGLARLWPALQVVEQLGVSVDAIVQATGIISRTKTEEQKLALVQELKSIVKSRYERENWLHVAQAIFDRLRQRKRDALAIYLMHKLQFDRVEQLFEHFLVDPGMEPVVQTSRLRLAISSVQLFIQRSFLNLETKVHPAALNSGQWEWMKRYRVWEANRKIFLFPEDWMEMEFRDDKTHLFQELESSLLQNDVTNDMAEDAFFTYLNKLEDLAQLELVAMCVEDQTDPQPDTLHLIGRTQNLPHKYFYRRRSHRTWTPWEPVTCEVEGDHLAIVVWRERLHLFWLTFMEKGKLASGQQMGQVQQVADKQVSDTTQKEIEIQLNWSEYFQGQWTTRKSGGFDNPLRVTVQQDFERDKLFITMGKESGGILKIHLIGLLNGGGGMIANFKVTGRNGQPQPNLNVAPDYTDTHSILESAEWALALLDALRKPYSVTTNGPTRFSDSSKLQVTFINRIENEQSNSRKDFSKTEEILYPNGGFSLLRPHFAGESSPFFWQDNRHTFFVEPNLVEKSFGDEHYGISTSVGHITGGSLEQIGNQAQFPGVINPPPGDGLAHVNLDWLAGSPATTVAFDGGNIGRSGRVILPSGLGLAGGFGLIGNGGPGSGTIS